MPDLKTIRWGIIGLGRFGVIHAETIRSIDGCELSIVCNHNSDTLQRNSKGLTDVRTTTDYREVLEAEDVDVISITTHWKQHFDLVKAALLSGKHVFVEKPMAETAHQCLELAHLACDADGMLMIGHICRFDPRLSMARQSIAGGQIGKILSMHAKRNLPKAPGNIRLDKIPPLMGDGIHDADLMMWFMQQLPSRIYARNVRSGNFTYPELGWAMLEFDSDSIGVIETVWCLPENVPTAIDARIQVIGTEGMLTVDCAATGFAVTNATGHQMSDTAYWPSQHGRRVGALANELSYFAHCVREGKTPDVVTPLEAANAVMVMQAAEESASTGQAVDITGRN